MLNVNWAGTGAAATASRSDHWHSSLNASDGNPTDALRVDAAGDVSINTTSAAHKLTVYSDDSETFRLFSSGAFGTGGRFNLGDSDFVYIDEPIDDDLTLHCTDGGGGAGGGLLTLDADMTLVPRGSDVGTASGAFLQIGPTTSLNIGIDNNEIMARSNGVVATLSLNVNGGDVVIGSTGDGNVGIGTAAPSSSAKVHVESDDFFRGIYSTSASGGGSSYGVYAVSTANIGTGIRGQADTGSVAYGVWGLSTSGDAGHFSGDVAVVGALSKSSGSFKIDHPMDPANKFLYHSFVESPDMMNVYNGNAVLDAAGEAVIEMPEWFGVLNKDFRYQLTAIGAPGPNLYIAEEIQDNRFAIAGGEPGMKVSWQVTGIRQDKWAQEHRVPVEQDKPEDVKGLYLHPELYGLGKDRSIEAPKERAWAEAMAAQSQTSDDSFDAAYLAAEQLREPAAGTPQKSQPQD